jgi:hypothetical protein
MRRALSAVFVVLSMVTAFAAFGVPVNTSWTYQGQLQRNGAAYNGTCDFQFSLWDAASAGTQQGNTLPINSVSVVNGLFTVVLDFGDLFKGDARWLGTSVQCSGDGGFTPLDPRQSITAAPYALSLRPEARIEGVSSTGPILTVVASVSGLGGTGLAAFGETAAVVGESFFGYGIHGKALFDNSAGVFGTNDSGAGIWGQSQGSGPAIYGQNTGTGLAGKFAGPVDITGPQLAGRTLLTVENTDGWGINASGYLAVFGLSNLFNGTGVWGEAEGPDSAGILGRNSTGPAIWGQSFGSGPAIYGQADSTGLAGRFTGSVVVEGNLVVQGTLSKSSGSFRIDHPLDPANKFLSHSFVESPDMKNIYDGNVTTDATGSAIVALPPYFEALNRDYRYQLTVLGQFAQAIVSRKIAGNSFEIRTDQPGIEVSWQVTGIRQDAYAQANPIVVEESKPAEEQGLYLFPAGFGASEEKQIGYPSRPATPQTEQKITKKTK